MTEKRIQDWEAREVLLLSVAWHDGVGFNRENYQHLGEQ